MRLVGHYRVVGKRAYRNHEPGTEFWARLDVNAERRALERGDIVLLDRLIPRVEPGSFVFPDDWLRDDAHFVRSSRPAKAGLRR